MSAEIVSNTGGILTARISGRLTQPELAALQASAKASIREQGELRFLIIAEDFQGWRESDDWSDVSFMDNDPYINPCLTGMALVYVIEAFGFIGAE